MMHKCSRCEDFGLKFKRNYRPVEYLEGRRSSKIWIIGLNPAEETDWDDNERDANDLAERFDNYDEIPSYFKDFKKVSSLLFAQLGKEYGVAHTDLVKCSSKRWPPPLCKGKDHYDVIKNCQEYLIKQIEIYKPIMIICNGAPVSKEIKRFFPIKSKVSDTCYLSNIGSNDIYIILSGFIGRVDDYAKRRLGYEIESILEKL